jgi:hypothetical protein
VGKSTNGPDWTDVATMMNAIGSLHGCQVVLTVTANTQGHNGSLCVLAEAKFDLLPGSSLPKIVSILEQWPGNRGRGFDDVCYNAVWQLDYAIGRAYENAILPE